MLGRMWTVLRKDLRTGSRDQLIVYLLLSPIVLGLLLSLLLPILEDPKPQFAVSSELDRDIVAALAEHGEVLEFDDRHAVVERVRLRDDVSGVVPTAEGGTEVIVEGDESEELQLLARLVVDRHERIQSGKAVAAVDLVAVASGRAKIRLIVAAMVGYTIVTLTGLLLGFTILEEKLTRTSFIYNVSPLRFFEYFGAKLALALLLLPAMLVPAVALPLGLSVNWLGVFIMGLAGLPFAVSMGLVIGTFANDQLGAIGLMKGLLPLWTSLPILGFVLPERWLWTQFAFANHWGVQGLFLVLQDGQTPWLHVGLAFVTGVPVLLVTAWLLRRRLGFATD